MVHEHEEHDEAGHGHGHSHTAGASERSLKLALALTTLYLIAELVGAWIFNSLALLSDAAHMFTDAAALAIALLAIRVGQRKADNQRTYGYRRFEILAAAFNAVLLFLVAAFVLFEGVRRFLNPETVQSMGMLIVACIGLAVNLVSMRILAGGGENSLNMKGAYLEVWSDMLGSLGVILAAVAIRFTGWAWLDPAVGIAIGLWVLPRTWILLRDTTHILLQGVPRGMELDAIRTAIGTTTGVASVHDLHLWSMSGDDSNLTAHVVISEGHDPGAVRLAVVRMLESEYHIHHATLQTETVECKEAGNLHA